MSSPQKLINPLMLSETIFYLKGYPTSRVNPTVGSSKRALRDWGQRLINSTFLLSPPDKILTLLLIFFLTHFFQLFL